MAPKNCRAHDARHDEHARANAWEMQVVLPDAIGTNHFSCSKVQVFLQARCPGNARPKSFCYAECYSVKRHIKVPQGQCIAGQPVRAPHGPYPPDLPRESPNRTFLSTPYTRPPSAFRKWAYPRAVAAMLHGSVDVSTRWRIYTPTKSSRTIQPSDAKIGSTSSSVRAAAKNSNAWRTDGPMRWGCLSAASISWITRYGAHDAREAPNRTILGATFASWLSSQCRQSPAARRRLNSAEPRYSSRAEGVRRVADALPSPLVKWTCLGAVQTAK